MIALLAAGNGVASGVITLVVPLGAFIITSLLLFRLVRGRRRSGPPS